LRFHAGEPFEEFAEEAGVGKAQFVSNSCNLQVGVAQHDLGFGGDSVCLANAYGREQVSPCGHASGSLSPQSLQ